jgi:hypothetical protein
MGLFASPGNVQPIIIVRILIGGGGKRRFD